MKRLVLGGGHPIFSLEERRILRADMRQLLGSLAFDLRIHQKQQQLRAKLLVSLLSITGILKTCWLGDAKSSGVLLTNNRFVW
jgi:hypothetical protein